MTERTDLIETLDRHRGFLLQTAQGLTEEQARSASTVSALTVASILKHVADTEEQWIDFAKEGAKAFGGPWADEAVTEWSDAVESHADGKEWEDPRFVLTDADTLDFLRARIDQVAGVTREFLQSADLDQAHDLPQAPWFEPGAAWSARRVALHVLAEISQHAGHADIIREALDGQKTMG